MTPMQIELVKSTFDKITVAPHLAGEMFYARLFELDPKAREMFRGDLQHQGKALFAMLEMMAKTLDVREKIVPIVHDLGHRHALYGVSREDYVPFRQALLDTLERILGNHFAVPIRDAWGAAYDELADIMQQAGGTEHHG
jgi:hemoglobin-like flavoprotein